MRPRLLFMPCARLAGGEDSYIGAIWELDDEEDDGEVVEEDGMFDMVYTGHCNKQGCKEVPALPKLQCADTARHHAYCHLVAVIHLLY